MTATTNNNSDTVIKDYYTLLKPRVMSLVVFSGFVGLWVAPDRAEIHPFVAIMAIVALALGSGAAGAFNMWIERDVDAKMNRTKNRPLPKGVMSPDNALGFAIFATMVAVMMMGLATNWVAAGIMAFASFFYVVIYTIWLKPRTPQNIVIGGAAGAFPPMIGWAAVTGDVTLYPIILFAIIFMWTPPHFWALALFANEDYKRADIPMMPVVKGEKHTKIQMLVYTVLLFPLTLAPWLMGYTGLIYGVSAIILSGIFILSAIKTLRDPTHASAKQMFGYSVFYLFALFGALTVNGYFVGKISDKGQSSFSSVMEEGNEYFKSLDTNGDGLWSLEEYMLSLEVALSFENVTQDHVIKVKKQAKILHNQMNYNGDSGVSFEEFYNAGGTGFP